MCNCTHLTSFVSQQIEIFSEQGEQFTSVLQSAEDLTLKDVAKSIGIILVLIGIWVFSIVLYGRDLRKRRLAVLSHLVRHYYNENYQAILEQIQNVYGRLSVSAEPANFAPDGPSSADAWDSGDVEMTEAKSALGEEDEEEEEEEEEAGDTFGALPDTWRQSAVPGRFSAQNLPDSGGLSGSHSRSGEFGQVDVPSATGHGSERGSERDSQRGSQQRSQRPSTFRPRSLSRDRSTSRSGSELGTGGDRRSTTASTGSRRSTAAVRTSIFALKSFTSSRSLDEAHQSTFKRFEEEMTESINDRKKVLRNWWSSLKEDNDLFSLICAGGGSWETNAASKRSVLLLAKVISFLFLSSLSAPSEYLCATEDDDLTDDDVASLFLDDIISSVGDMNGSGDAILSFLYWFGGVFFQLFWKAMWVLPVTIIVWFEFSVTDLLHETDDLHEERLMEIHENVILMPQNLVTVEEAMAAEALLFTLDYVLKRQHRYISNTMLTEEVKETLTTAGAEHGEGVVVDDHELSLVRAYLDGCVQLVSVALANMQARVGVLKVEEMERNRGLVLGSRARSLHRKKERARNERVLLSQIPEAAQLKLIEQKKLLKCFNGTVFGYEVPAWLGRPIKWLKRRLYMLYLMEGVGASKASISRRSLTRLLYVVRVIFVLYLVFCTVFVYLFAVSVQDNDVINTVLIMVSVQYTIENLVTGPVKMLVMAGVIPALVAFTVVPDIQRFIQDEHEKYIQDEELGRDSLNPIHDGTEPSGRRPTNMSRGDTVLQVRTLDGRNEVVQHSIGLVRGATQHITRGDAESKAAAEPDVAVSPSSTEMVVATNPMALGMGLTSFQKRQQQHDVALYTDPQPGRMIVWQDCRSNDIRAVSLIFTRFAAGAFREFFTLHHTPRTRPIRGTRFTLNTLPTHPTRAKWFCMTRARA